MQIDVVSAISTMGFPIVMCLVLSYYIKEEVSNLRETINNNTIVITKLLERIDIGNEE